MNDKPNSISRTRQTYDQIASGYSARIDELVSDSWVGEFERQLIDRFLSMAPTPNSSILDIGCGNGKDTDYLSQKGATPLGIDISPGMLKEARKRIPLGILCQMDMRNLGFYNGTFDGAWANGCIYHVPKSDLPEVLKEVWRVLKPSGVFSFNAKAGHGERLEKRPRSFQGGPRFYAYYSIDEMRNSLERVGFEVLETKEYPQKIFAEEIFHLWARKPG